MAALNQVLVDFNPTLTPTRISVLDVETPAANVKAIDPTTTGNARQYGKGVPLAQINGLIVPREDIISLTVSSNDFMPTVQFSFIDGANAFGSTHLPIHTPILSVYMASTNPVLKSLSADFIITNIRSMVMDQDRVRYDYSGELYVPNLNNNRSIAFRDMTSVDVMRAVAKSLGLGFATNEAKTDDRMTWINPNLGYRTFLQNVSDRAYKNEKSFFQVFIDRNYILNFINVERQFSRDKDIDSTYMSVDSFMLDEKRMEPREKRDPVEVPMILSNSIAGQKTDMHIAKYAPISDNGDILRTESFKKRVKWYSHGDQTLEFFVEPISDLKPENGSEHQTPTLTDFTDSDVVKWLGTDNRNSHPNYKFARVINMHNEKEIGKNMLKVELSEANFSIPRGSRILVNIYRTSLEAANVNAIDDREKEKQKANIGPNAEILDERLSDFYYVKEVVTRYRAFDPENTLSTEMILSRRNWKTPPPKTN